MYEIHPLMRRRRVDFRDGSLRDTGHYEVDACLSNPIPDDMSAFVLVLNEEDLQSVIGSEPLSDDLRKKIWQGRGHTEVPDNGVVKIESPSVRPFARVITEVIPCRLIRGRQVKISMTGVRCKGLQMFLNCLDVR